MSCSRVMRVRLPLCRPKKEYRAAALAASSDAQPFQRRFVTAVNSQADRQLTPITQRIDQQGKSRRRLTTAWIVEVITGKRRAPVLKHALQATLSEMRLRHILGNIGQPESGQRRIEHLRRAVEDELAFNAHLQFVVTFFDLPCV